MRYEILVNFDDETADVFASRRYFRVLDKYNAVGMGHEKTRNSSFFIRSENPLNLEQLAKDLGDIKIVSVHRAA